MSVLYLGKEFIRNRSAGENSDTRYLPNHDMRMHERFRLESPSSFSYYFLAVADNLAGGIAVTSILLLTVAGTWARGAVPFGFLANFIYPFSN